MPIIEKIIYRERHISIDCDDGETFRLPYSALQGFKLEKGKAIESLEYRQIREESEKFQCREKSYSYLSVRARSTFEIQQYLKRKGFSFDIIREVLRCLEDAGYLNDYEFAMAYTKSRLNRKAVGENLLRKELAARGISRNIITKVMKKSGASETDMDRVYAEALKKYGSLKGKKNSLQRVYRFLLGRGFDNDTVRRIIQRISDEEGEDACNDPE